MKPVTNVIIAGVGGQGVVKASDILTEAVFRAGFDVKKSEIHGMSQRGGSVASDIRFGEQVLSPMVPPGEADFILVMSEDEAQAVERHAVDAGVGGQGHPDRAVGELDVQDACKDGEAVARAAHQRRASVHGGQVGIQVGHLNGVAR